MLRRIEQPFFYPLIYLALFALFITGCITINVPGAVEPDPAEPQPAGESQPEYRYDNFPDPSNLSNSVAEFRAISKWSQTELSYYFINDTERLGVEEQRQLIREAFDTWAAVSPLTFIETADRDSADMEIGWATGNHGDGDAFDGPGGVLAHATFPNPYTRSSVYLHFDDDERWLNSESRDVDLKTVAIHEIGHALGLGHSRDPNAIMFASYQGADRTLGEDDIRGIQALYGVNVASNPAPEAPPSVEETPPPVTNRDSDNDGLSDAEEILATGTDPENADTDGDGLGDGLEVLYRLNPLNPDMDRDGVSDGDEVRNGTDPTFADQQIEASPELVAEIQEFLTKAINLEIETFYTGNANLAADIFAGDVLQAIQDQVQSLNQQDLAQISTFDYYNSYLHDVRVVSEEQIDVDTCEVWTTTIYRRSTGTALQAEEPQLLPQTLTLQKLSNGWFITAVEFYDAPAFCE